MRTTHIQAGAPLVSQPPPPDWGPPAGNNVSVCPTGV